jgi:hypothetical protein
MTAYFRAMCDLCHRMLPAFAVARDMFMTALARTDVPGLSVRLPSGEWFPS